MGLARDGAARFRAWHRTLRERHLRPYVFIHINKTGGSSVEKALGIRLDHSTAAEKYRQLGASAWSRKFVFSFVRNPWDKVVSHYHYRVKTNQTGLGDNPVPFEDWLQRVYLDRDPRYFDKPRMFMPQRQWLLGDDGEMLVDYVGRFESLNEDSGHVCRELGLQAELGHAKPSSRGGYQQYYTETGRAIIERHFAEDIAAFGYTF